MCQVRAGGTYLELYDYPNIEQQPREEFWNTLGTKHLCFYVEHGTFDDTVAYLKQNGVQVEECDGKETPWNQEPGDCRSIYFYDPNGNQFQIIEDFFPEGCRPDTDPQTLYRTKRLFDGPRLAIHHIGAYCSDLDRATAWYEKELNVVKVWEGPVLSHNNETHRMALLRGSDFYWELQERPECSPQPANAYWGTHGVKHISLYMPEEQVPDLVKYLKADGIKFTVEHHWDEQYNNIPGGYTVCFFPDPDGTTIEINGEFFPGEGLYPGEPMFDD